MLVVSIPTAKLYGVGVHLALSISGIFCLRDNKIKKTITEVST